MSVGARMADKEAQEAGAGANAERLYGAAMLYCVARCNKVYQGVTRHKTYQGVTRCNKV